MPGTRPSSPLGSWKARIAYSWPRTCPRPRGHRARATLSELRGPRWIPPPRRRGRRRRDARRPRSASGRWPGSIALPRANEGHFADHATSSAPPASTWASPWLEGPRSSWPTTCELDAVERRLLAALAARFPVRRSPRPAHPRSAPPASRGGPRQRIREVEWKETPLAPIAPSLRGRPRAREGPTVRASERRRRR